MICTETKEIIRDWFDPECLCVFEPSHTRIQLTHAQRVELYYAIQHFQKELESIVITIRPEEVLSQGTRFTAHCNLCSLTLGRSQLKSEALQKLVNNIFVYEKALNSLFDMVSSYLPEIQFGYEPDEDKPFEVYTVAELAAHASTNIWSPNTKVYLCEGVWRATQRTEA